MNERSIKLRLTMVSKEIKNTLNFVNFLIKVIPKFINKNIDIKLEDNSISITTNQKNLILLLNFLKNNYLLQFKTLISITAVDYPERPDRFEINYFLLSYKLNKRIIIKVNTNDVIPVPSITNVFSSANWYEREVWDLFGVFFSGHPDLRRILTDYGFEGFPFRKDFPQTGFVEVRYDDQKKYVLYEPVEMAQEFRSFDFISPWTNIK